MDDVEMDGIGVRVLPQDLQFSGGDIRVDQDIGGKGDALAIGGGIHCQCSLVELQNALRWFQTCGLKQSGPVIVAILDKRVLREV